MIIEGTLIKLSTQWVTKMVAAASDTEEKVPAEAETVKEVVEVAENAKPAVVQPQPSPQTRRQPISTYIAELEKPLGLRIEVGPTGVKVVHIEDTGATSRWNATQQGVFTRRGVGCVSVWGAVFACRGSCVCPSSPWCLFLLFIQLPIHNHAQAKKQARTQPSKLDTIYLLTGMKKGRG